MHVDDVARAARRRARASRANGCSPRSTSWARTRAPCSRRSPARTASSRHGILAEPMAAIEARWRAEHQPTFVAHGLPMPPAAHARATAGRATASRSAGSGTSSRWSAATTRWRRGDRDRARRPGPPPPRRRRRRSGRPSPRSTTRRSRPSRSSISGSSTRVDVDGGRIAVELLPTFVGCPALEVIRGVRRASAWRRSAVPVEVGFTFARARGRPSGSRRPAGPGSGAAGIAPPARPGGRALPVLRLGAGRDGQRVRPDAVPLAVLLPRLPPAVRGVQASLTAASGEADARTLLDALYRAAALRRAPVPRPRKTGEQQLHERRRRPQFPVRLTG